MFLRIVSGLLGDLASCAGSRRASNRAQVGIRAAVAGRLARGACFDAHGDRRRRQRGRRRGGIAAVAVAAARAGLRLEAARLGHCSGRLAHSESHMKFVSRMCACWSQNLLASLIESEYFVLSTSNFFSHY